MLDNGAHDSCSKFGAHGQLVTIEAIGEAEHFLFNNISRFANAAPEQGRLFEHRCT